MTSSQCFWLPKVWVERELISKKILSPKIFDQATAFLLTLCCLAFPKAQSSHGLNILVTWIPIDFLVAWVIDSDGWSSLKWRSLIFSLWKVVADCALSLGVSHRKSTLATQPSWFLIWWSRMILLSEDWPWFCSNSHLISYFFAKVGMSRKIDSHLPWGKTS